LRSRRADSHAGSVVIASRRSSACKRSSPSRSFSFGFDGLEKYLSRSGSKEERTVCSSTEMVDSTDDSEAEDDVGCNEGAPVGSDF
jgi:hypothetical protein